MLDANRLIARLAAECNDWIADSFPPPQLVDEMQFKDQKALYMYLQKANERSKAGLNSIMKIAGECWEILYIGESGGMNKRAIQHKEQIRTCKDYNLWSLLSKHGRADEIYWDSAHAKELLRKRKREFSRNKTSDNYRNSDKYCKKSAGWSLATHVTHIGISELKLRRRIEYFLIGIVLPRLNRLSRLEKGF